MLVALREGLFEGRSDCDPISLCVCVDVLASLWVAISHAFLVCLSGSATPRCKLFALITAFRSGDAVGNVC